MQYRVELITTEELASFLKFEKVEKDSIIERKYQMKSVILFNLLTTLKYKQQIITDFQEKVFFNVPVPIISFDILYPSPGQITNYEFKRH